MMSIIREINDCCIQLRNVITKSIGIKLIISLLVFSVVTLSINKKLFINLNKRIPSEAHEIYAKAKSSFASNNFYFIAEENEQTANNSVLNSIWIKPSQFNQNYDKAKLSALAIFLNIPLSELYYKMKSSYQRVYLSRQVDESIASRVAALHLIGIYREENIDQQAFKENIETQKFASNDRQNSSIKKQNFSHAIANIAKTQFDHLNVSFNPLNQFNQLIENPYTAYLDSVIFKSVNMISHANKKYSGAQAVVTVVSGNDSHTKTLLFLQNQATSFSPLAQRALAFTVSLRGA